MKQPAENEPLPPTEASCKENTNNTDASPNKVHHVTVCMVPTPQSQFVWKTVGEMRRRLKDPGYYRWPPHANLLYPFLEVQNSDQLPDILHRLRSATSRVQPFRIRLNRLGTFGGKRRGVLWLFPDSTLQSKKPSDDEQYAGPPLLRLHRNLQEAFPMCQDQTKGGTFTPHMTLSHFESLDDALRAQEEIERNFSEHLPQLEFLLDRIYLLRRQGDGGQFLRIADIGLGSVGIVEDWSHAPCAFPDMPAQEDDWVYEERMKLKKRRNFSGRGRRGGPTRSAGRREPRIPDTPEVVAAKRAERKAKKERLERDQQGMLASNEEDGIN